MLRDLVEKRERCPVTEPRFLLGQFSDWADWIKRELAVSGVDVPSDEMCVLFAASSVRLADRIHEIYSHVPRSLRTRMIQAAILHQCWAHQMKFRQKIGERDGMATGIPALDALDLDGTSTSTEPTVIAADGHSYRVRFPQRAPRDMELVTEVICFLLAEEMGLRVPPIRAVRVKPHIAARLGVLGDARVRGGLNSPGSTDFCCLGLRRVGEVEVDHQGKPPLPLGPRGATCIAGVVTFHVLTLSAISEKRVFQCSNGRAEPILTDFRHCLMNANWPRFQRASYRERVAYSTSAQSVKSYKQLEAWVQRAGRVSMERICETVVKLPGDWYQSNPMAVVGVLEKLRERAVDLRRTILDLIHTGFFVGIEKPSVSRGKARRVQ